MIGNIVYIPTKQGHIFLTEIIQAEINYLAWVSNYISYKLCNIFYNFNRVLPKINHIQHDTLCMLTCSCPKLISLSKSIPRHWSGDCILCRLILATLYTGTFNTGLFRFPVGCSIADFRTNSFIILVRWPYLISRVLLPIDNKNMRTCVKCRVVSNRHGTLGPLNCLMNIGTSK